MYTFGDKVWGLRVRVGARDDRMGEEGRSKGAKFGAR